MTSFTTSSSSWVTARGNHTSAWSKTRGDALIQYQMSVCPCVCMRVWVCVDACVSVCACVCARCHDWAQTKQRHLIRCESLSVHLLLTLEQWTSRCCLHYFIFSVLHHSSSSGSHTEGHTTSLTHIFVCGVWEEARQPQRECVIFNNTQIQGEATCDTPVPDLWLIIGILCV